MVAKAGKGMHVMLLASTISEHPGRYFPLFTNSSKQDTGYRAFRLSVSPFVTTSKKAQLHANNQGFVHLYVSSFYFVLLSLGLGPPLILYSFHTSG